MSSRLHGVLRPAVWRARRIAASAGRARPPESPLWPKVAVCAITADRRIGDHSHAIPHVLDYPGPYSYYVNVQLGTSFDDPRESETAVTQLVQRVRARSPESRIDTFEVRSEWRARPRFDQDQTRLWGIAAARNLCRDFAMAERAEWLLFLDSDVHPPPDAIQRLLEVAVHRGRVRQYVVGGVVRGRGAHEAFRYATWPEGKAVAVPLDGERGGSKTATVEYCQHGTMGFVLIHRRVFNWLPFTWVAWNDEYVQPDGRVPMALSEDPAFGITTRRIWGRRGQWCLRLDLEARHSGDLGESATAQF